MGQLHFYGVDGCFLEDFRAFGLGDLDVEVLAEFHVLTKIDRSVVVLDLNEGRLLAQHGMLFGIEGMDLCQACVTFVL